MATHLITGGCGFIGSNLVKKLLELGEDVTVLDNNSTGKRKVDGVNYYYGETYKIFELPGSYQYIWHLGEYARVEQSFNDYEKVIKSNYNSFPTVVEYTKLQDAKLIYSGSSTKFSKGDIPGYAMSPYAYTKWQNTNFLQCYDNWYGLKHTIVYFYNVYGDDEIDEGKYATVIGKFLKMKKDGATELPVTEPGTQLRNFTHIDDTIKGLIYAGMKGSGDGWGIASDESYSILDVVEMLGCKPKMIEGNKANRMDAEIKNQQLKDLTDWKAEKNLKEYIKNKLDE